MEITTTVSELYAYFAIVYIYICIYMGVARETEEDCVRLSYEF